MFENLKQTSWEIETRRKRFSRRLKHWLKDWAAAAFLLMVAVVLTAAFVYAYSFLVTWSYFQIKEISVYGLKELTEKDILSLARVRLSQNLFTVNVRAVRRRVASNPWIESVYVGRELPSRLVLDIQERIPIALVKKADDFYLMDVKGHVFKKMGSNDDVDLPIITGMDTLTEGPSPLVLTALQLLKKLSHPSPHAYMSNISEIHVDDVFGISLVLDNGLFLKLGMGNFEKRLQRVERVLSDLENRGISRRHLCIDVSDDAKVTVSYWKLPPKTQEGEKGENYLI